VGLVFKAALQGWNLRAFWGEMAIKTLDVNVLLFLF
jgi:hypothetical protein